MVIEDFKLNQELYLLEGWNITVCNIIQLNKDINNHHDYFVLHDNDSNSEITVYVHDNGFDTYNQRIFLKLEEAQKFKNKYIDEKIKYLQSLKTK